VDLGAHWSSLDYSQTAQHLEAALALARESGEPAVLAETLNRMGNWQANTGRLRQALNSHAEALQLYGELRDRPGLAATGDLPAAVDHLDAAVELWREVGDRRGLASSLGARGPFVAAPTLAETTFHSGWDPAACLRDGEEAAALMRDIDWPAGLAYVGVGMGPACAEFGDFGGASRWTMKTLDIAREVGHRQWLAGAYFGLGHLHLRLLDSEGAIGHFAGALEQAVQLGSSWWRLVAAGGP
jgi:tetratricopeptide (TPR) repeat protein